MCLFKREIASKDKIIQCPGHNEKFIYDETNVGMDVSEWGEYEGL